MDVGLKQMLEIEEKNMDQKITIGCREAYAVFEIAQHEKLNGFPLLYIDANSYIVSIHIHSGLDMLPYSGRHCLAIGKSCSLSGDINALIDLNHDYLSVTQGIISQAEQPDGSIDLAHARRENFKSARKGSIIIQNDVWIGYGATLMSGITLHNGCVVAAKAVVTKDVPPYAIVGGNPAKVIRYRFAPDMIDGLQRIAWWDWPKEVWKQRIKDFKLPVEEFVRKYLPLADTPLSPADTLPKHSDQLVVLLIPDIDAPFPLYKDILRQYFAIDRPNVELLIYLPEEKSSPSSVSAIESILQKYEKCDTLVTLQTGVTIDERILMQYADYFVTTREPLTVHRTCLADLYHTKILYGTDEPLFHI